MSDENKTKNPHLFSTRDLLVIAVLAALGGVTSTYVNTLSDAVHAALGFAGATQWAAGLHVIWIVLAMGILRKLGVGTLTGILKGLVELMSGNSHGVIILLVTLVAGLLVDCGFFIFTKKQHILPYLIGGGLATASNVLIFQLFATIPQNIIGLTAIFILILVALASGLVFAGILPFLLVNALSKAAVVKIPEQPINNSKAGWWVFSGIFIITILLALFLITNLQGPQTIQIGGAVGNAYEFPNKDFPLETVSREMAYRGVTTEYHGYPLVSIIDYGDPDTNANTLLIEASDGYAFLINFDELNNNPNILLVKQGQEKNASFDIVGPESSKAWVRNISKLSVISADGLSISYPSGATSQFDPNLWVSEMDSAQIALPDGSLKLQGVPVYKIIEQNLNGKQVRSVIFKSITETIQLNWSEIENNDDLRVFTIIEDEGIAFALAEMTGQVRIYPLIEIEIE